MPLADDIEEFRRNITRAVEELEEVRGISDRLLECTVDEIYRYLAQLQDLCGQVTIEIKRSSDQLIEINAKWGSQPLNSYLRQQPQQSSSSTVPGEEGLALDILGINLKNFEDGIFFKFIQSVLQVQNSFSAFPNLNQAKGALGESLCHIVLNELFQNIYFLDGQVGVSMDTSSEELAYQAAHKFFTYHPKYEFAVASRPFGGGQPYSLDIVTMLINKSDVENWLRAKRSTATYFVFESKTDSARLSEKQRHFSYVKHQALYMFRNRNKIEDRSQLGKDLLKALDENRVLYVTSLIDLQTGNLTAKFIQ